MSVITTTMALAPIFAITMPAQSPKVVSTISYLCAGKHERQAALWLISHCVMLFALTILVQQALCTILQKLTANVMLRPFFGRHPLPRQHLH